MGDDGAGRHEKPQAWRLVLADADPKFAATVFLLQRIVVVKPDAKKEYFNVGARCRRIGSGRDGTGVDA